MFGAVKLKKHPDIDQYKYSGYGIGFDRKKKFSIGDEIGRNVIIFWVDMSSSQYIDKKKKFFFNSWKRSYTRIRRYTDCRKIVFNQPYCK